VITSDRGDVIHFAGHHHLSPAVRDGAPALVGHGDVAGRCGWATFFEALERRALAARFDPEDGASFSTVPRAKAAAAPRPAAARGWRAEVRRFAEALRGRFAG
jgi:hypothetical protein